MKLFEPEDTVDVFEKLLLREREAILGGRYHELESMASEKERLLNAIRRTRITPSDLAELKKQSERNSALLDAMRSGVSSAIERLRAMRAPAQPLTTYDPSGRRTKLGNHQKTADRRV